MGVELEVARTGRNYKFPGHKWNAVAIRRGEDCVKVVWSIGSVLVAKLLVKDLPWDWFHAERKSHQTSSNMFKPKKNRKKTHMTQVNRRCKVQT